MKASVTFLYRSLNQVPILLKPPVIPLYASVNLFLNQVFTGSKTFVMAVHIPFRKVTIAFQVLFRKVSTPLQASFQFPVKTPVRKVMIPPIASIMSDTVSAITPSTSINKVPIFLIIGANVGANFCAHHCKNGCKDSSQTVFTASASFPNNSTNLLRAGCTCSDHIVEN